MASATQSLTTYYAKRIIGDAAAADETSALLQTGADVVTDTWILHRTNRNKLYGIKYLYDNSSGGKADKIELYGDDASAAWVELDTGDVYIMGKVGIGYDPNTTGNLYKLYVDGDVYFDDTTYLNGNVGIGYDPATSGNTYKLYVDGNIYADDTTYLNGKVGIGYDPNTAGNTYKLRLYGGSTLLNSTTSASANNLSSQLIVANTSEDAVAIELWRNTRASWQIINDSGTLYFKNNWNTERQDTYSQNALILDYNTGNAAFAGTLAIGQTTRVTDYKLYVNGTSYLNGTTYVNSTLLMKGTNLIEFENSGSWGTESPTFPNNRGGLYWSGTSDWVKIFCTETSSDNFQLIFDFGDDTSPSMILRDRGTNKITLTPSSGEITSSGTIYANGGYLKSTLNGNTVQIGSQNTGYCHITSSANIPFWFNKDIWMENGKTIGAAGTTYRPFQIYLGRKATVGSNAINAANPLIEFSNSDRSQYGQLIYTDYDSVRAPDGLTWVGNQANSWFQAPRVFGAVWNDYAEYRETKDNIQPGRCVVETGHGDLVLSTERLQPGCEIVSDTFGFAIGETSTCKTPTACAGRVLAYLYEDRSLAKPGDPVCSGPNGTVSIMTHEEEVQWPSRIIATISEIPDYEEWEYGSADEFGNKEKLKVDGRIWIRVR